ncbi:MAG TPA: hypothetical protein VMV69_28635 [Pirellulales bacterium]|nr:hypothetical protein [Pirellulales bacterium]
MPRRKQPSTKKRTAEAKPTVKVGERMPPYRVPPDVARQIADVIRTLAEALEEYGRRRQEDQLAAVESAAAGRPLLARVLPAVVELIKLTDAATKPGKRDVRLVAVRGLVDGMLARLKWQALNVYAPPAAPTGGKAWPPIANEIDMSWRGREKYEAPSLAEYIEPLRRRADELANDTKAKRLTKPQEQVWEYLVANPDGKLGKEIVTACRLVNSIEALRNHIIPSLIKKGRMVNNGQDGQGYYPG